MSETTVGENQGSRLSRMAVLAAVLSFLSACAALLLLWGRISNPYQTQGDVDVMIIPLNLLIMVVGSIAVSSIQRSQGKLKGIGLAKMGIALGIISVCLLSLPDLMQAGRRSRHSRAAWDAETAVIQAIVYAKDKGVYPTSLRVLREEGYANIADKDLWGNDWVLSPVLIQGGTRKEGDNVYVFSRGYYGTGEYPQPFTSDTGEEGSIGYSSVHGAWGPYLSRNRVKKDTGEASK